jgi:putative transcriptional regulator
MGAGARTELAERIAGEVAMSDDPGATLRKWRTDFEVAQSELAEQLDVSPSVVSDYESGRRDNPGIRVVQRIIQGLLDIDEARGGSYIRQHARVLSAGFDADVVLDLREYTANVSLDRFYEAIDATELVRGEWDTVAGHTVIDSVEAITRLTGEEFYQLYGQSTNRALAFTNVSRGKSPLVALRVALPTPNAVVLHGIDEAEVWEHATDLARIEGCSVAVTTAEIESMLEGMRGLP